MNYMWNIRPVACQVRSCLHFTINCSDFFCAPKSKKTSFSDKKSNANQLINLYEHILLFYKENCMQVRDQSANSLQFVILIAIYTSFSCCVIPIAHCPFVLIDDRCEKTCLPIFPFRKTVAIGIYNLCNMKMLKLFHRQG